MSKERTVCLALPRNGDATPQTMRAAYVSAKRRNSRTFMFWAEEDRSLLDYNFNSTWCTFLTGITEPGYEKPDYYVLLASDVEPLGDGWLDTLLDELEASAFPAIHAPCAIKNGCGLTSTAIGRWDEPYGWYRRLTTTELFTLPSAGTWGYKDMCRVLGEQRVPKYGCLLPNTGLLAVSRERFPCNEFPGFNCENRLVWKNKETGEYLDQSKVLGSINGYGARQLLPEWEGRAVRVAEFAPEDWQLGRWAAEHGVQIGGTRAVETLHHGRLKFGTNNTWGHWAKDESQIQAKERQRESIPPANYPPSTALLEKTA